MIVNSPTANNSIVPTVVYSKPIEKLPETPGVINQPIIETIYNPPISDTTEWYYFSVQTAATIFNYKKGQPNKITTFAYWIYPTININENNTYENMRFEVRTPSFNVSLTQEGVAQNGSNLIYNDKVPLADFRVSKEFLNNFKSSNFYINKRLDIPFLSYTCRADNAAILEKGFPINSVEVSMLQFFKDLSANDTNKSPGTPAIIDLSSIIINVVDPAPPVTYYDGKLYIHYKS